MKKLLFAAVAALATAAIAMPATPVSPVSEAQIATESAAQPPAQHTSSHKALEVLCVSIRTAGDDFDVMPSQLRTECARSPHQVVAAAGSMRDRDPVAPHPLL